MTAERIGTTAELEVNKAHRVVLSGVPIVVVKDAAADPRFAGQPFVVGAPFLRFYAGAPVFVAGEAVGTVCVFDVKPRAEVGADAVEQDGIL